MKSKLVKRLLATMIILLFCISIVAHLDVDGMKGTFLLDKEVNFFLKIRSETGLRWVSANDVVFHYLINLPPDAGFERTSGAQGGSKFKAYYVSTLNHHKVSIWMSREDSILFGPQYKITDISELN